MSIEATPACADCPSRGRGSAPGSSCSASAWATAATLSGGDVRRPAAARRHRPGAGARAEGMLFDEVACALDPELAGEVLRRHGRPRRRRHDHAVVTHEMDFARQVADRVVIMDHGVIAEEGPPAGASRNRAWHERARSYARSWTARLVAAVLSGCHDPTGQHTGRAVTASTYPYQEPHAEKPRGMLLEQAIGREVRHPRKTRGDDREIAKSQGCRLECRPRSKRGHLGFPVHAPGVLPGPSGAADLLFRDFERWAPRPSSRPARA